MSLNFFGNLLGGFAEASQQLKQQRLEQETNERNFRSQTLQYLMARPETAPEVRGMAGQLLLDMGMEHLGYKPSAKKANPLEKILGQLQGQDPSSMPQAKLGRGPGTGSGNSKSSVGTIGGAPQPAAVGGAEDNYPLQGAQLPNGVAMGQMPQPPPQMSEDEIDSQHAMERDPSGLFLTPAAVAAQDRITKRGQAKVEASILAQQKDMEIQDLVKRGWEPKAAAAMVYNHPAMAMGTATTGEMSGADLIKEMGSNKLPSGADIDPFGYYKTWTGFKDDGTLGVNRAEPALPSSGAQRMTTFDPASNQWVQVLVDAKTHRIVPGFKLPAPPTFANMVTTSVVPRIMTDAQGNEFIEYVQSQSVRTPGQPPNATAPGMTPIPVPSGSTTTPQSQLSTPSTVRSAAPRNGTIQPIPGAVNPKQVPAAASDEQHARDVGTRGNLEGSMRLIAGGLDGSKGLYGSAKTIYPNLSSAIQTALSTDPKTPIGIAFARYSGLTPEQAEAAGNALSANEDLPAALRATFGAPVARGKEMLKVMQEQQGNPLGNPEVTKNVLRTTLRTLGRQRFANESALAKYDRRPILVPDIVMNAYLNIADGNQQKAIGWLKEDHWFDNATAK